MRAGTSLMFCSLRDAVTAIVFKEEVFAERPAKKTNSESSNVSEDGDRPFRKKKAKSKSNTYSKNPVKNPATKSEAKAKDKVKKKAKVKKKKSNAKAKTE